MQRLKLSSRDPSPVLRCRPMLVSVDGRRRRDLQPVAWEVLPAPEFGRSRLVRCGPGELPLPQVGSQVLVVPPGRSPAAEFRGVAVARIGEIAEQADPPAVEVRHALAAKLSNKVTTRHQLADGEPIEMDTGSVGFNTGPDALASAGEHTLNKRTARVFSAAADATRWTAGDALAYLLAACAPGDVEVQGFDELRELGGGIDVGALDVTNRTVGEALVAVAGRAGLELRAARRGPGLVFYRPGRHGRLRSIRLQPPGSKLLTGASNLLRGELTFRRRPGRRGVLALGARKRYEATFELSGGWDPALETGRWRDFVRSRSADWPAVAEVYRKWVLNEHGRYGGAPRNLPTHDFSPLDADAFAERYVLDGQGAAGSPIEQYLRHTTQAAVSTG
jgi:hypothetical protein